MVTFQNAQRAFGERVRAFRKARRLTQVDLGRRSGMTSKFVGQVERGANLTLVGILALARGLEIRPEELFTAVDTQSIRPRGPSPQIQAQVRRAISILESALEEG